MPDGRHVLITGIAGAFAGSAARDLERHDEVARIVGVDGSEPSVDLERTEFVQVDRDESSLARVIESYDIDTVVHLSAESNSEAGAGHGSMKERDGIGAMQVVAACQNAPSLKRFVLKSSTAVYGSSATDPAVFPENLGPAAAPTHGFGKDMTEIEGYVRGLGRRRQDIDVSILRFAHLVGSRLDSPLDALFALPVVPRVLGFDPRLQFCHEQDALEVMNRVVTQAHPGITNVAGEGALYLSQCIRLAGLVPLPVPGPFLKGVASLARRDALMDDAVDQLDFLRYGRVVDTARLRSQIGYHLRYSSREAFEAFLRHGRSSRSGVDGHQASSGAVT